MDEVLGRTLFDEEERQKEERAKKLVPLARDIVMVLVKTIKATKMYLPNNPIYQKFREELKERLDDFFKEEEYLSFNVKKFELTFLGQQVYHNPDMEDNLALLFFKDGVREFCFHSGVTPEETNGFIEVLELNVMKDRELDDDLVTLLWERDFQNITYTATEEATDEEADEEEAVLSFGEDEGEAEAVRRLEELGARAASGNEGPRGAVAAGAGMASFSGTGIDSPPQDGDGFEKKRGSFQAPDDASLLSELTDIFYEMLVTETDQARFEAVADSYTRALELFINRGDLALATILVLKVQELLRHEGLKKWAPRLEAMLDLASSEPVVQKVGSFIDQGGIEAIDLAGTYLRQMDSRAVGPMVGLLETLQNRKARKAVCDVIAETCNGDSSMLTPFLSHKRWYVIRNVATILVTVADQEAIPALGGALKHPDPRVRKEVLLALAATGGKKAEDLIAEAVLDPDMQIRRAAGRMLVGMAPDKAYGKLHALIETKEFESYDFNEKRDIFELYGRAGGEKAIDLLSEKFKKKGFLKSQKKEDTRAGAAYGLAAAGGQRAIELLELEADSKSRRLRTACLDGLRKARQGGAG